ncbi:MAG: hypothetical protein JNK14_15220 [Chitinophagaceae bacterium]|nr:hypothetical protein [Chitinophagaceae bacterium]
MRIIVVLALIVLAACNSADKTENVSMTGSYKMLSQSVKSEQTDTTYTTLQQLKIFTPDHMMYANVDPADSASAFGVGTYSSMIDTITEHVIFSASDTSKNETSRNYKLTIDKTKKGYKQIIPDIEFNGQTFTLTEEYDNAGSDVTSPLDGVWKLTAAWYINGKDTSAQKMIQYKAYYAGHVIWGHSYTDSLNKNHTGVGFGKFTMTGNDKVKESMMVSTYNQIRGKDFDIAVEMKGTDEFTQTITEPDGSKAVETYQRLKKQ